MGYRTPKYRSFRRTYGGDPDSTILRDLHQRITRLERDLEDARIQNDLQMKTMEQIMKDMFIPLSDPDYTDRFLSGCKCADLSQHLKRCQY